MLPSIGLPRRWVALALVVFVALAADQWLSAGQPRASPAGTPPELNALAPFDPLDAAVDGAPVAPHLDQADIDRGQVPPILVQHQGDTLFRFMFTRHDGAASHPLGG